MPMSRSRGTDGGLGMDNAAGPYAHTGPGPPGEQWQRLEEHLSRVAELAGEFASAWNARDWGYAAGLWHDLGKAAEDWQEYLRAFDSPQSEALESEDAQ